MTFEREESGGGLEVLETEQDTVTGVLEQRHCVVMATRLHVHPVHLATHAHHNEKTARPRWRIEVPPTAFRTETLTLTLTSDQAFPSTPGELGHNPHMEKVKVRGHSVQTLEWKQTDRRTDGQRRLR